MTWHPIKENPPKASEWNERQVVAFCSNITGAQEVVNKYPGPELCGCSFYTHWRRVELVPPPEKKLSQEDSDRDAFAKWFKSLTDFAEEYRPGNAWLAGAEYARKSLREEMKEAVGDSLPYMIRDMDHRESDMWAAALRKLSHLIEGEAGK